MLGSISGMLYASEGTVQKAQQPNLVENMIPILFIFVVMYLIVIRPQTKKAKEHMTLLAQLKTGDEVVTTGGIIGRIKTIADDFVTLEAGNANLKILKENIQKLSKSKTPSK